MTNLLVRFSRNSKLQTAFITFIQENILRNDVKLEDEQIKTTLLLLLRPIVKYKEKKRYITINISISLCFAKNGP